MSVFELYDMAIVPAFCLLMASEVRVERDDTPWGVRAALMALGAAAWPTTLPIEAYLRLRELRAWMRARQ